MSYVAHMTGPAKCLEYITGRYKDTAAAPPCSATSTIQLLLTSAQKAKSAAGSAGQLGHLAVI